jgi:hypothetical protein
LRAVNTGFVTDWETAAVAVDVGIGVVDALQMVRAEVTDYVF